jgi:hypothetical protein
VTRSFHGTALQKGGMSPPLPPFARSPVPTSSLTENTDAVWDDGVAPELALDFDAPHISTKEAIWTLLGTLSVFVVFYQGLKLTIHDENPALPHHTDLVIPDYSEVHQKK